MWGRKQATPRSPGSHYGQVQAQHCACGCLHPVTGRFAQRTLAIPVITRRIITIIPSKVSGKFCIKRLFPKKSMTCRKILLIWQGRFITQYICFKIRVLMVAVEWNQLFSMRGWFCPLGDISQCLETFVFAKKQWVGRFLRAAATSS